MQTRTRRQRETLYAGIAGMPLPDADRILDRFDYGYARKPHSATTYLLYDMHRFLTRPAGRALPGILAATRAPLRTARCSFDGARAAS
jgi:hypothetical protein